MLDGYPKSYKTAEGVFFIRNKPPEKKYTVNEEGEKVEEEGMDEEELKKFLKPKF